MNDDTLYLRQLRAGRDFAIGDLVADQMANFSYLVGDRDARECVVVDPAWDIDGIVAAAQADGMTLVGALVTHYHQDHIGGHMFGHDVQGLARLMAVSPVPVHVNKAEAQGVCAVTGLSSSDLVKHDSGDRILVGKVEVECLHTPGHTPGSQCFRCGGALIAGDTLFLQGCGRVDLPGGDPDEMYRTLTQRLATLPGDLTLYPGHHYSVERSASLSEVRQNNSYLGIRDIGTWRRVMGG